MSATTLSHPAAVMSRLTDIEEELAERQNALEAAALEWFKAKRERERNRAKRFLAAQGTVAQRSAIADEDTAMHGVEHEALYEAQKGVVRVLETRASIGMALLKAQSRS